MIILGLNAYHGDSSACIIKDGKLIAAVEEERFTRIKHWAGMPIESIKYCLKEANVSIEGVDYIAINRDPKANIHKKLVYSILKKPNISLIVNRLKNSNRIRDAKEVLKEEFGTINAEIINVEHHTAHLASSFFVSKYEKAAVVSIDGFGDFVGAMWGVGRNNKIEIKHKTYFPHSLGLLYLAITQYLGFPNYGDEYKVMGLAAYGEPTYFEKLKELVSWQGYDFKLNLEYFNHHKSLLMTWENGEPKTKSVFSKKMEELLGPKRDPTKEITQNHMNMAASLQKLYETILLDILNEIHKETKLDNLCFAGGCAMNSLANGKILENTPFKNIYIQPAAGDAGGSIGAAYYLHNHILEKDRNYILSSPYLGPQYSDEEIKSLIQETKPKNCKIKYFEDPNALYHETAKEISKGHVIGWFQGRMEWGPRALGNRSILGDPRRADMKDILNLKIKRRESFRPFAPSILNEEVPKYFEQTYPDPFMLKVYKVKKEKRERIPAVVHKDGTGRLQTVSKEINPRYHALISKFYDITGIPILLNTSFNENEPVVCSPKEALNCFLRTNMDVIVLNNYMIKKDPNRTITNHNATSQ